MVALAVLALFAVQQGVLSFTAVHEGCFSTSLIKSNSYYQVQFLLTWEECLRFCDRRLTTHVAFQAEYRYLPDNHCYCGNDLERYSSPVDNTSCFLCLGQVGVYCGGQNAMSLYKLRDSTPLSIILAQNGKGVMQFTEGNIAVKPLINEAYSIIDINYLYTDDEIYFIRSNLYRSVYRQDLEMFEPRQDVWSSVDSFTLDWTSSNRTYISQRLHIKVIQSDISPIMYFTLFSRNQFLRDLSFDPYKRILFFTEGRVKVYRYDLSAGYAGHYFINKIYMTDVHAAIDVQKQLLYVTAINERNNRTVQLISMNYDGSQIRVLYNGPELTKVYALDVFRDTVVWINYKDKLFTMYKCQLTPRCENLKLLHQTVNDINKIIIYHPERQTPGVKYLCSQLGCSHSCDAVSLFVVSCSCPPEMTIAADNITCQGHNNTGIEVSSKTIEHSLSESTTQTGQTVSSEINENSLYESTTQTVNLPAGLNNLNVDFANESDDTKDDNARHSISYFEILALIGFLLNIITLTVIYFKVCRKKPNNHTSIKFNNIGHICEQNEYEHISQIHHVTK